MRLFRGLDRTDYQDVLRAIGLMMDERGFTNFRLVEHEDGVIVQVMPRPDAQHGLAYETYLLTDADLSALLEAAYQRRGSASADHGVAAATPTQKIG